MHPVWIAIIFALWIVVVGIVEVASTTVVERHGAVVLLFTKHIIGTLTALVVGYMMRSKIPPFYWSRQLVASWRSLESRLFIGVAVGNMMALYCMYSGYGSGGMAGAYAFKSTEPLMTCILSTMVCQRLLSLVIASDHLTKKAPPGLAEWFSVGLVCFGSTLCSIALHGSTTASVTVTSAWIVASNFAFGVRTVFQKALFLESPVTVGGQTDIVVRLFVDMGTVGSIFFAFVFVCEYPSLTFTAPGERLETSSLVCMMISGVGYFIVQALNCLVLLYFSSVAYSVAKQVRVIALFLFSAAYFAVTFQHPMLALAGGLLVIVGTVLFALRTEARGVQDKKDVLP